MDSDGHISEGSSQHHGSSGTEGASASAAAALEQQQQQQQQHLRLLSSVYQAPGSMASFLKRSVVGVFSLQADAAAAPGLAEEEALAKASQLVAHQPPRAKAAASAVAASSPEAAVLHQPQEEPSGKKYQRPKEQSKAQREEKKDDGWGEEEGAKEEEEEEEERPMVDISNFLKTSGTLETRYMRMLASLCALTYVMPTLTVRTPSPPPLRSPFLPLLFFSLLFSPFPSPSSRSLEEKLCKAPFRCSSFPVR